MPTPYTWPLASTVYLSGTAQATATALLGLLSPYGMMSFTSLPGEGLGTLTLLPVELRLTTAFPYPALEECRRVTMAAVTTGQDIYACARAVTKLALSTEQRASFQEILGITEASVAGTLRSLSRSLDVDRATQVLARRTPAALLEMTQFGLPLTYKDLLERALVSKSFNHRVSGLCAMLLIASQFILESEATP